MDIKQLRKLIREMREESVLIEKPDLLFEANIGRAKEKIEQEKVPFVMMTAFRGDYNKQENRERNKELKMTLTEEGLPWVDMPGSGYKEGGPEGEVVVEDSVLIWDEERGDVLRTKSSLFSVAKGLAKEFEQDSFLYGGPDQEEEDKYTIRLYASDGTPIKEVWAGGEEGYRKLNVVDLSQSEYWSMLGSKATQFTEMRDYWKNYKATSRMEAMKKQHHLKLAENMLKKLGVV